MELREVVHWLLEYTPKPADVDTVPVEDIFVDVVMAANVVSVKAIPIITNAITAVAIESLRFAVIVPCQKNMCIKS
jgi:histidine ammonia-lyase